MMYFNNEIARKQLIEKKVVVTYRVKERIRIGLDIAVFKEHGILTRIGKIYIKHLRFCKRVITDNLNEFLSLSGFDSVDEWIKAIKSFDTYRREPQFGYLYHVELRELF